MTWCLIKHRDNFNFTFAFVANSILTVMVLIEVFPPFLRYSSSSDIRLEVIQVFVLDRTIVMELIWVSNVSNVLHPADMI
jgi:uncharacterized membrane protein (DUF373 family)